MPRAATAPQRPQEQLPEAPTVNLPPPAVGADPRRVRYERFLGRDPWMHDPDCAITVEVDPWNGVETVLITEHARFQRRYGRSVCPASRQALQHNDAYKRRLEADAHYRAMTVCREMVAEVTTEMRSFQEAAQRAAASMQAWQYALAQTVYEGRRASGWLCDSLDDMEHMEHFEVRVDLDERAWAQAARSWNDAQIRARRQRTAQPMMVSLNNQYVYPGQTFTAATTNMTHVEINHMDYTGYVNQWNVTLANTMAYPPMIIGQANGTDGTGNAYFYQQIADSNTTQIYSLDPTPLPCDCENAGTCSHCVERRVKQEQAQWRVLRKKRERIVANGRGHKLLMTMLDEAQKADYDKTKSFLVVAGDGRLFRLRKGKTAELLDAHKDIAASYCIHLFAETHERDWVNYVDEDTMIAQLFMLWHEPQEFDRIANITPRYRPVLDTAQAQRYLEEHDRESEAMLRAEGIANPRQWVEGLRQEVRARYVAGQDAAIVVQGQVQQAIANAVVEDEIFEVDRLGDEALAA